MSMRLKNRTAAKTLSIIALSVLSQSLHAVPFSFEGRSLGMGGVSVATADLATASWANPAMLTNQRPSDDFSLLIGVGAFLRDDEDLISDIDDFQAADDRRNAAVNAGDVAGALQAATDMSAIISGIDGKIVAPEITSLAAVGIAFDSFALAISIRGDALAAGTVTNLSQTALEVTDPNFNILNLEGILTTEIGLSLAKAFQVFDTNVSIGIKPKVVDLTSFTYTEAILTASTGLSNINDDSNKVDLGTFTTVDIGLAADLSDSVRLGLNVRNLITDEFDVGSQILNFDTEARIGLAYHNRLLTIAVDYDLIENEPLLANPTFDGLKTQYVAVGAEFNAFDFAQLRVGARKKFS
ncbi:MAG: hypothetical protein GQ550_04630 [Gammaproteobacteria bacterium]|nr:hypothetical protein [Gammaproteobacteria bacterium]